MSSEPPGGNGITSLTGFEGNGCATAAGARATVAATASSAQKARTAARARNGVERHGIGGVLATGGSDDSSKGTRRPAGRFAGPRPPVHNDRFARSRAHEPQAPRFHEQNRRRRPRRRVVAIAAGAAATGSGQQRVARTANAAASAQGSRQVRAERGDRRGDTRGSAPRCRRRSPRSAACAPTSRSSCAPRSPAASARSSSRKASASPRATMLVRLDAGDQRRRGAAGARQPDARQDQVRPLGRPREEQLHLGPGEGRGREQPARSRRPRSRSPRRGSPRPRSTRRSPASSGCARCPSATT